MSYSGQWRRDGDRGRARRLWRLRLAITRFPKDMNHCKEVLRAKKISVNGVIKVLVSISDIFTAQLHSMVFVA